MTKDQPAKVVIFKERRALQAAPEPLDIESCGEEGDYRTPIKDKSGAPRSTPLSPASQVTTPTTLMLSPSEDSYAYALRTCPSKEQNASLSIQHTVKTKGGGGGVAKSLTKPVAALLGSLLLLSTGAGAYFFTGWLGLPGLNTQLDRLQEQNALLTAQVDELEKQVDRLEFQVDRLSNETDRLANETTRLEGINEELEQNVAEFSHENDRLNVSLVEFHGLNIRLNESIAELAEQNQILRGNLDRFEGLNKDLNQTVNTLEGQVNRLEHANDELDRLNGNLWQAVDQLSNETAELSELNAQLNTTTIRLWAEVDTLSQEIDRLAALNVNLATLVSFVNETSVNIDDTFEEFTRYLSDQITGNRVLVMETLETLYLQRASFWDCDFREYFLTEEFTQNRNEPIGVEFFPEVLDYVHDRVLSDLCLSRDGFETFLVIDGYVDLSPSDASFNDVLRAVGRYTDLAIDHYFPRLQEDPGLTPQQWAKAQYNCLNLPQDLLYTPM